MAGEIVQDPFWASWGNSLANTIRGSGKTALDNTQTAEQIWALREKRARETAQWEAAQRAAAAYPGAVPEATAPTSYRDVTFQPVGPANPADVPTPDENLPLGNAFLPTTTSQEAFIDPKALEAARKRRQLAVAGGSATILKDPSQWAAQQGYGEVASAGVPTDPRERARIQFQTTGKFPTSDETKTPNAQNFTVYRNGEPTGNSFASLTGGRTKLDGSPVRLGPGEELLESGPGSVGKPNPIETVPIAQNNFNQLAAALQAKIARGEPISNAELDRARQTRNAGWVQEVHMGKDPLTGKDKPYIMYKIPPPTTGVAGWLHGVLADIDKQAGGITVQQQPPAPAEPQQLGDPALRPPEVAPPPAPTQQAPAEPPSLVQQLPAMGTGEITSVLTNYRQQPVIVSLENAKNGYTSLLGNIGNNDKSADLAIIVGAAKILDPPSVVREGEVENVKKTGGIMDQFIGLLGSAKGESGLSPQVRAQLWQMVNSKLALDVKNADAIRQQHAVQLAERGVKDPNVYLPPLPVIEPVDVKRIASNPRIITRGAGAATEDPNAAKKPVLTPEEQKALDLELGVVR